MIDGGGGGYNVLARTTSRRGGISAKFYRSRLAGIVRVRMSIAGLSRGPLHPELQCDPGSSGDTQGISRFQNARGPAHLLSRPFVETLDFYVYL